MTILDHALANTLIHLIINHHEEMESSENNACTIAHSAAIVFRRAGTPDSIKILTLLHMLDRAEISHILRTKEFLA